MHLPICINYSFLKTSIHIDVQLLITFLAYKPLNSLLQIVIGISSQESCSYFYIISNK